MLYSSPKCRTRRSFSTNGRYVFVHMHTTYHVSRTCVMVGEATDQGESSQNIPPPVPQQTPRFPLQSPTTTASSPFNLTSHRLPPSPLLPSQHRPCPPSAVMASNPQMELDPKYDHYDFPTTSPESKSGHPGHTTKEQDAAVHQLRMMLEQAGYHERLDTLSMLRFLRARKFNAEMSKQM